MEQKFEVGDKVRAWGVDGVVSEIDKDSSYPVVAVFKPKNIGVVLFDEDGKYQDWHKEPSLFLVEKAKKEEPIVQWYDVLTLRKLDSRPTKYHGPYRSEDDFLNTIGFANDNFDWIKLTPVCKTQGNKLVEE